MKFTVTLTPAEEGGFVAQCVEVPGAISEGETKQEALENISGAIARVLEVRMEEAREQARRSHAFIQIVEVNS